MPGRNGGRDRGGRTNQPPPGGAAGAAQQTQASMPLMLIGPWGRGATRYSSAAPRRRKKVSRRKSRRTSKRTVRSRKSGKRAHMVRGSAAAKRHMAKLRRMQKRRR